MAKQMAAKFQRWRDTAAIALSSEAATSTLACPLLTLSRLRGSSKIQSQTRLFVPGLATGQTSRTYHANAAKNQATCSKRQITPPIASGRRLNGTNTQLAVGEYR